MTKVFIAGTRPEERFALSLMMRDLHLDVVGEAADWATTLSEVPESGTDILLVDWDILPGSPHIPLDGLREACPQSMAIVLISRLDARQQAALSSGADTFISKAETADRVTQLFMEIATRMRSGRQTEPGPLGAGVAIQEEPLTRPCGGIDVAGISKGKERTLDAKAEETHA